MLDRTLQPVISNDFKLAKPEIRKQKISENLFRYSIHNSAEDVFKLELIFAAGTTHQQYPTQASLSFGMITEGTSKYSAEEISSKLEYYGCILQKTTGREFSSITLFCLNKHAAVIIPFLKELIEEAIYPERDFEIERKNKRKSLEIQLQNTDVVAERILFQNFFQENSPFSKLAKPEDYDNIERRFLQDFHQNRIIQSLRLILLSGNCTSEVENLIDSNFISFATNSQSSFAELLINSINESKLIFEPMKDSVQCSICAGLPLFNMAHPDYPKFMLLNTAFGAYFGSRLMSNLREKNGFTYGVSSMVRVYVNGGMLIISTDVGKNVAKKAIEEIKKEMQIISNEKIGEEELQKVKNYFAGSLSRSFDSVFSVADRLKQIHNQNVSEDFYEKMLMNIKDANSQELLELAKLYLNEKNLVVATAGAME